MTLYDVIDTMDNNKLLFRGTSSEIEKECGIGKQTQYNNRCNDKLFDNRIIIEISDYVRCSKCGEEMFLNEDNFYFEVSKGRYKSSCKKCCKAYQLKRRILNG